MRKGELVNLTWEDIDLENSLVTARHTAFNSKKTRKIHISSF